MLKGARFQKRITLIPGLLRINLSKSGASLSAGPQGADVNIGKDGVTTSAGIPGTGLSYRQKMGGGRGWLGVLLVIAGLGWWAFQHQDRIAKFFKPAAPAVTPVASVTPAPPAMAASKPAPVNTAASSVRYVRRQGAILREEPRASGKMLKKNMKGDTVTLISQSDGWAQVTDGTLTGWMRASTIGAEPPR
jgi:uncharacterized protein DUF4236/SH3 domain-containing protein